MESVANWARGAQGQSLPRPRGPLWILSQNQVRCAVFRLVYIQTVPNSGQIAYTSRRVLSTSPVPEPGSWDWKSKRCKLAPNLQFASGVHSILRWSASALYRVQVRGWNSLFLTFVVNYRYNTEHIAERCFKKSTISMCLMQETFSKMLGASIYLQLCLTYSTRSSKLQSSFNDKMIGTFCVDALKYS